MSLDALSIGLIVPVVPALVKSLAHGDAQYAPRALAIMMAAFACAQLFAAPILGGLSDRFGRRKVILISICGMAFDFVLTALAPTIGWLFIARAGAGLTSASIVSVNAYIADVTPPEKRAQRFGLVGATIGASFVLGPAMGGALGAINLRLPFWAGAGLCAANLIYGILVLPESLPKERRRRFDWRRANPFASLKLLLGGADLARLGVCWFLTWFGMNAFPVAFVISTNLRFGWNTAQNGIAIALFGGTQVFVQALLARKFVAAFGERAAARAGYGFTAISALILALASQSWMIWLGCVVAGLGSLTMPAIRAMVSSTVTANRQGEAQGALSAVEGVSSIVAPLVAGEMLSLFSTHQIFYLPGAPFLVSAAAACIAVWLMGGLALRRVTA